ncbi:hypothetical protein D7Z54_15470 [Salibacterium salarium]|uniref:Quinol monooxygenase YgiN n=1 Tax=Salibacterium salarium TaxID=284579 RepID=A0A428N284_9BACI|nr:MFS transporter [Salibacterium salarium]RSL32550.1 hypothetical protein D7Z54_15470 [Salibacterium salarium]
MSQNVHIFIEYKINPEKEQTYQQLMGDIATAISHYGAEDFQWYQAVDQTSLYVEMFKVPSLSSYHTLKRERGSKNHELFGKLDECVDGGLEKVHCWAFYEKQVN